MASIASKFRSSALISWKSTGKLQQTLAGCIERTGVALHSGKVSTVKIWPHFAGEGRWFDFRSNLIPASIDFVEQSPLCTTLLKDGLRIRTVEHLLSALEASGVDNCRIEIDNLDGEDKDVEVPIFDGSAREWVEAIEKVGLEIAKDSRGNDCEKIAPYLNEPVHFWHIDSFVVAFPSPKVHVTFGIDFPQVPAVGCQWFSSSLSDDSVYKRQIAPARTFCIYEEVCCFILFYSCHWEFHSASLRRKSENRGQHNKFMELSVHYSIQCLLQLLSNS
ncbi:probable UDP-3-O-acyl-N-acetylglucosamine deacetylase 2, mitochondrial isoform X2 [Punica granatum]|uniref:UDP-3-O-acyl-N-acetylglucosamine deacetylase n=1 Tax=Punica granatum TaxID=22663 RepID=A0A6P8D3I8_PUNGR|nr:probable UDP-3-O-acyl-N-acetylglucosamine deacetylase 2, mitochondrial isoform X2 [Punica granatum]